MKLARILIVIGLFYKSSFGYSQSSNCTIIVVNDLGVIKNFEIQSLNDTMIYIYSALERYTQRIDTVSEQMEFDLVTTDSLSIFSDSIFGNFKQLGVSEIHRNIYLYGLKGRAPLHMRNQYRIYGIIYKGSTFEILCNNLPSPSDECEYQINSIAAVYNFLTLLNLLFGS